MSRSDWDSPRDKGPQIEERERRWKKRGGKKRFAIERRYVGKGRAWFIQDYNWHIHRRYQTEKQRDTALRTLNHRRENSHAVYMNYEYRAHEPDKQG